MKTRDANAETRIRERFLADHRAMESLLSEVIAAFEANDRERVASVWALFDARLVAHMDAEERHLIPLLLRQDERAARAILEEHKHLRSRLLELGTGVDLHTVKLPAARAFIHELEAHSAHEDRALYSWADRSLDEKERKSAFGALGDTFDKAGTVL